MHEKNYELIEEIEADRIEALYIGKSAIVDTWYLPHKLVPRTDVNAVARLWQAINKSTQLRTIKFEVFHEEEARHLADILLGNNTSLQVLEILPMDHKIRLEEVKILTAALAQNKSLRKLNLYNIHHDGVDALASMLEENRGLQTLDLESCGIDDAKAIVLAESLKKNKTLLDFGIRFESVGSQGAEAFADMLDENKTLVELCLSNNEIDDTGAYRLAKMLEKNKTLENLDIGFNEIGKKGARAIAVAIKRNKTLKSLSIARLSDEGVKELIQEIRGNATLKYLDISQTSITDKWAAVLAEDLKDNTTLEKLELRNTGMQEEGIRAIRACLEQNWTLQSIDLSDMGATEGYDLGEKAEKIIAEIEAKLKRHNEIAACLQSINRSLSKGSLETTSPLEEAIKKLDSLIPGIGTEDAPFADHHPIAQNYRLLQGLRCIMQWSKPDIEVLQYGFELLSMPFDQPHIQKIADQAMGHALFVSSVFDKLDSAKKAARYQLILNYYRTSLADLHCEREIKICLIGLKYPNKRPDPSAASLPMLNLIGAEKLLSYGDMLKIGQKALDLSDDKYERNYLKKLLQQRTYDPMTSHHLWQCRTFRQQFLCRFPNSKSFRILENYILNTIVSADEVKETQNSNEVPFQKFSIDDSFEKPFDFTDYLNERKKVVMAMLFTGMIVGSNASRIASSTNDQIDEKGEKGTATSFAAVGIQSQDPLNTNVSSNDAMETGSLEAKKRPRSKSTHELVHEEASLETKKQKPDDANQQAYGL